MAATVNFCYVEARNHRLYFNFGASSQKLPVLNISVMDRKIRSLSLLVVLELRISKWEKSLAAKTWGCGSNGSWITE